MKISIITATYNSSETIEDCITSVNNQTYSDIEQIIIDGASKDNTVDIITSLPNRVSKIISEADKGIYDAMNKGINLATGDIIGILNSDDLYYSNDIISKIVESFQTTDIDCIFGDLFYVNPDNTNKIVRKWSTGSYKQNGFIKGWHPAHPTFFVRKEVYEKYGCFDLNFKLAADFELMLRFLEKNKLNSKYLKLPMVRMRLGGATSGSFKNIIKQNLECLKAFKNNGIRVSLFYPLVRVIPKLFQFIKR